MRSIFGLILMALLCVPLFSFAEATLVPDIVTIELARVSAVSNEKNHLIPGTETPEMTQTLTADILQGPDRGTSTTFENDYIQLAVGDEFYLRHTTSSMDGTNMYAVSDPYRLPALALLAIAFIALIFIFGGIQGVRGLASLAGSIVLIFFALIPAILHGYSPIIAATSIAGFIIVIGSYITHGFNKTTSAAVVGMLATVSITALIGYWAVHATHLSGFNSEESAYLNLDIKGGIDLVGLLFGGIMIGLLGVLYDIAIGQAVAVEELLHAGTHLTRKEIYVRALRIGREHIGALVNTLAIAYVGASLPLLLLVQTSTYGIPFALNSEVFATEIVRILIGSIGLVLCVPITTYIASRMLSVSDTRTDMHTHHH